MDKFVTPVAETMSVEELRKYRKQVNTKEYYNVGLRRILNKYALLFLYKIFSILGIPFESSLGFWI